MKVVLICMMQLHKTSGSARTAFENIRYFTSRGWEVHVAAMTLEADHLRSLGAIPHKMFPWFKSTGETRRRWYDWQVQRLRRKLRPDLTVGHGDIQEQDVLTLHNCVYLASELIHQKPLEDDNEMALTHGPILREKKFKRMIANSELMKRDTVTRFGIDPALIDVVYPALDTKTFSPARLSRKEELRKRFGFPDKVIVGLVTSGNFRKRGLDLFIAAIELLPPEVRGRADFRVLGKDEKGEWTRDYLTFDPGLPDIENYFNALDVFVLPARIEEFGRVVTEAMGCGLPVITTDKVGAGEILTAAGAKYVLPTESPVAIKSAMEELILRPELRSYLGELNARLAQGVSEERLGEHFDRVFAFKS